MDAPEGRCAMTTEAEAIARLRKAIAPARAPGRLWHAWVIEDDLRALLDAHAALEAAHAEALDALVGALHVLRESDAADAWDEESDVVQAVLAKAGRR